MTDVTMLGSGSPSWGGIIGKMKPGSPEWTARLAALLAEELEQPERWWYLSFAGDAGFLGAAIVKARGITSATARAHLLGINPGGQVLALEVPPGKERMLPVNRLLTREEIGPGFNTDEMEARGLI